MFSILGSNDKKCGKYSHWTVLCEDRSNDDYHHKYWTKYCEVDDKILTEFKCLGITVLNNKNSGGYAALKGVRMWKKVFL